MSINKEDRAELIQQDLTDEAEFEEVIIAKYIGI